jgi:cytochrome c5
MVAKNKRLLLTLMAGIVLITLIACNKSQYKSSETNVVKNTNSNYLQQGEELYTNKCGKCHKLFAPEKFNKKDWTKWVGTMAPKAKLTAEEKAKVLAYVTKGE